MAVDEESSQSKAARDATAGGIAGAVSRVLVTPFDVVKIRLQNQVAVRARSNNLQPKPQPVSHRYRYTGIVNAFTTIYSNEGFLGLWRGNVPAIGLWVIYSSVQFPVYHAIKDQMEKAHATPTQTSLLSGAVAAFVAQTVAYPLDTMRTRYIAQGPLTVYPTLPDLWGRIWVEEGPRGFFKGWLATISQLVPTMALTFTFYEQLKLVTGKEGGDFVHVNSKVLAMLNGTVAGFLGKSFGSGWKQCDVKVCVAKLTVYPLDTVKKRMQLNGQIPSVPKYDGLVHCVTSMLRHEGVGVFYNGVTASLLKTSFSTGITFMVFETVRAQLGKA